ncbi:DNA polymerase subunit beta [Paenibacillus sp. 598K]|uniref:type VII toxin-antitoxin system MntA family adenylyltransferase antitoxin n=1 Tax=Paenibacillus sp. 598K TaxID=1117987 RepID=UPI000FFA242D|nr:nucleotidyltransferase domain-containing protein [Paenibacillus sp. 598K]GBF77422.1 DNA polymerase subunit beta [Paenibacillus sp. 598K]
MQENEQQHNASTPLGLSELQCEEITKTLVKTIAPASIIMFGSLAKGTFREESDLDLAYLPDKQKLNAYERFRVAAKLADIVGREVDLVDFNDASPVLQIQIIESGLLLYDACPKMRQERYMRAMKEYVMLNDERREIVHNRLGGSPT